MTPDKPLKQPRLPVDGWVILDKPAGLGSTQAVARVKRLFQAQKAGHAGTLDPFADGLLPIALGEATKTINQVMGAEKAYRFHIRWGIETNTLDTEGTPIAQHAHRPDQAAILAVIPQFLGTITQVPPIFSALKIDGKRAYDLARQGETPEMKPRQVTIHALELTAQPDADHAIFTCRCSKGTYIRALARDLAQALGTVGHLVGLRRLMVAPFTEADAISLEALADLGHKASVLSALLPLERVLDGIPALMLTQDEAARLRLGQAISLIRKIDGERIRPFHDGQEIVLWLGAKAIGFGQYAKAYVKPVRLLQR